MTEQPPDPLRDFIIAAHTALDGVKAALKAHPEWLDVAYDWGERGGQETALGAAAHTGHRDIAEYLLGSGASLTPPAAASLGMTHALEAFIDADPAHANTPGAHGIPLLAHAAFSGNTALLDMLKARGNTLAGVNFGLLHAAATGKTAVAVWMLDNGADLSASNHHGKTARDLAEANGHQDILDLLKGRS